MNIIERARFAGKTFCFISDLVTWAKPFFHAEIILLRSCNRGFSFGPDSAQRWHERRKSRVTRPLPRN